MFNSNAFRVKKKKKFIFGMSFDVVEQDKPMALSFHYLTSTAV